MSLYEVQNKSTTRERNGKGDFLYIALTFGLLHLNLGSKLMLHYLYLLFELDIIANILNVLKYGYFFINVELFSKETNVMVFNF